MFPEQANCVVAGFSIHKGYQVFRLQFVVQAKATAIDCVSLFTGVAGLELGLRGISWLVFMLQFQVWMTFEVWMFQVLLHCL